MVNRKRVVSWLGQWGALVVLWFVFVDKLSFHETLVGVVAAGLAATGAEAVRGLHLARFLPYPSWLLELWRVPGMVLDGCWVLLKVLLLRREIRGEVRSVRFDPGGDDARSAARRAMAIAFTTVAPNLIVIDIDRNRRLMLYHQVLGTGVPTLTKHLGAQE